eukprot:Skav231004  [mRNA]  locus=scaffold1822:270576:279663:- [translate_table: standard]
MSDMPPFAPPLRYLVHLLLSKRLLPRRQEAQEENFTKDGETRTALVSHEELQRWSEGTHDALICSISHAWETREHPDPCKHQLQQVVNHAVLYGAAFEADVWIFYDYTSLFQFERTEESHEVSFRRSMNNMHLLYAHEYSLTFRIQSLTRDDAWNEMMENDTEMIQVWVQGKGLELKPLKALVANRTPYGERGWCKAEIEWSSLRSINAQFQQIDKVSSDHRDGDEDFNARLPMTPEDFRRQMEQAAFTHRSDASAVIGLQEKIFVQKVTNCEDLLLEGLPATEMMALARALPQYTKLKSLRIRKFRCGEAEAKALAEACCAALAEGLKACTSLRDIKEGNKALSEAFQGKPSLRDVNLSWNRIDSEGAQALEEAIDSITSRNKQIQPEPSKQSQAVTSVTHALSWDVAGPDVPARVNALIPHQALAEALKANRTVAKISLHDNKIGDAGAEACRALAEALKANRSVTEIDLTDNTVPILTLPCGQVLAEALKANRSVTEIDVRYNNISDDGIEACPVKKLQRVPVFAMNPNQLDQCFPMMTLPSAEQQALNEVIKEKRKMGFEFEVVGLVGMSSEEEESLEEESPAEKSAEEEEASEEEKSLERDL